MGIENIEELEEYEGCESQGYGVGWVIDRQFLGVGVQGFGCYCQFVQIDFEQLGVGQDDGVGGMWFVLYDVVVGWFEVEVEGWWFIYDDVDLEYLDGGKWCWKVE